MLQWQHTVNLMRLDARILQFLTRQRFFIDDLDVFQLEFALQFGTLQLKQLTALLPLLCCHREQCFASSCPELDFFSVALCLIRADRGYSPALGAWGCCSLLLLLALVAIILL